MNRSRHPTKTKRKIDTTKTPTDIDSPTTGSR